MFANGRLAGNPVRRVRVLVMSIAVASVLSSCGDGRILPPSAIPPDQLPSLPTTPESDAVAPTSTTSEGADGADPDSSMPPGYSTVRAEGEWTDVTFNLAGLDSTCGNVSAVSAHPSADLVVAGIATQGLWSLDRESTTWNQLGTGPGSAFIDNRLSWIEYDPADPAQFWEAGMYGGGLYRTNDQGATFVRLGDVDHLDHVSVDLQDPLRQTMLVGGHERRAVLRSVDGGLTFTDITEGLPVDSGNTPYPVVVDAMTYLLGTEQNGVYRSVDAGATWTHVLDDATSGPPRVVGDTVYWLLGGGGGLMVSRDAGASFVLAGDSYGDASGDLMVLPNGDFASFDSTSVVLSADEGATWTRLEPPLPFVATSVTYSPARAAFFASKFTCSADGSNDAVPEQSVMRLDVTLDG